jgi:glycosyltransferase involved in cell wall biosynthesis
MSLPLVSIIIPYYNKKDTINRSVDSVLTQTHANWELIIIDDKSQSPLIVNGDWNSQQIICLKNNDNLGPGLSRQKGLDIARGEFICFLDSDDYWLPDFLSESLNVHLDNPSLCATYTQSNMIDGNLRRRNNIEDAQDDLFYAVVSGVRPWATCALMWKRKYLSKWSAIRTNEDALFELETALNNPRVRMIPQVLCVIDKGKEINESESRLYNFRGNINRTVVLLKALRFLKYYSGQRVVEIKLALWKSLYAQMKKMIKQHQIYLAVKVAIVLIFRMSWKIRS